MRYGDSLSCGEVLELLEYTGVAGGGEGGRQTLRVQSIQEQQEARGGLAVREWGPHREAGSGSKGRHPVIRTSGTQLRVTHHPTPRANGAVGRQGW